MGLWVLAGVLAIIINVDALTYGTTYRKLGDVSSITLEKPKYFDESNRRLGLSRIHSASTPENPPESHEKTEDYVNDLDDQTNYQNSKYDANEQRKTSEEMVVREFDDDEDFKNEDFLGDITGYQKYKTSRSFNHEGPSQTEMINTQSYHRRSQPYDVSNFQHKHDDKEEHAEVHYHQHKHLHKHSHKQEHMHKHKQEHKHEHGHKHDEQGMHKHAHKEDHKHKHESSHHHKHKEEHKHSHKQDHKHDHHHKHKHDHSHHQEHKHDHHHKHSHKHDQHHKHSHSNEHKHHHGHKHGHKHHHDHKHGHKHGHSHSKHH